MKKLLLSLFLLASFNSSFADEFGGDSTFIDLNVARNSLANIHDPRYARATSYFSMNPEGAVLHAAAAVEYGRSGSQRIKITHHGVCVYKNGSGGSVIANVQVCGANSAFLSIYTTQEKILGN
ncbi:hypothetical protein I0J10_004813 [Salmonella enterica]|nr:hypothetical protein [Salmonella enterica]